MKKVINGKMYNTKTAELIAGDNSPYGQRDFQYEDTGLYKTKKGAFFLAGEGGPMSRWAKSCGNNCTSGGEGIEPLTQAQALAWCEENDVDSEIIAENFTVEEA